MLLKKNSLLFSLIVITFLAIAMIRDIGIYRLISLNTSIVIIFIITYGAFFLSRQYKAPSRLAITVGIAFLLIPYSLLTSRLPSVSILFSYFTFCSVVLFSSITIIDSGSSLKKSAIHYAKLGFIIFISVHALLMVSSYVFLPKRTTGLLDDFSQAAFIILCAYAMAYPIIKKSSLFLIISIIAITAIFAAFSRTSNALLALFLIAIFIFEYNNKNLISFWKVATAALLSLAFIYLYPFMMNEDAVSRGGLHHLSTLNSRTIYWETAWNAIMERPIWGHGIGAYTFTGIKEAQPFHTILFIHNDYLQVWHDLGIFWLILLCSIFTYTIVKYQPFTIQRPLTFKFKTVSAEKFIAWCMITFFGLYMCINFLITNLEFQIALALFFADIYKKEQE